MHFYIKFDTNSHLLNSHDMSGNYVHFTKFAASGIFWLSVICKMKQAQKVWNVKYLKI